jgi:hypothetical protein
MWREFFDAGKELVEGVAKGEPGTKIFLSILVIVFGMVAKPFFEWLAEKNRPLAGALIFALLVFALYMAISTYNYENEMHDKPNTPQVENANQEETTGKAVDSSVYKPEIKNEATGSDISTDTTTSNPN